MTACIWLMCLNLIYSDEIMKMCSILTLMELRKFVLD